VREDELPAVEGLGGRSSREWIGRLTELTERRGRSGEAETEEAWALVEERRLSKWEEEPEAELEWETDFDMPVSQERKPWLDDEKDGAALEVLLCRTRQACVLMGRGNLSCSELGRGPDTEWDPFRLREVVVAFRSEEEPGESDGEGRSRWIFKYLEKAASIFERGSS